MNPYEKEEELRGSFIILIVLAIFGYLFVSFLWHGSYQEQPETQKFLVEWRSMEQYGIYDGQYVETVLETPNLNDTVVFDCQKPGCQPYPYTYIKKLVTIRDDGCYWLEGNKEAWYDTKDSLWHQSDDSRGFGWLCPEQINIQGVIHEKQNYSAVGSPDVNATYLSPAR